MQIAIIVAVACLTVKVVQTQVLNVPAGCPYELGKDYVPDE